MNKKILMFAVAGLLLSACSKAPEPVKLDDGSATAINQGLILKKSYSVQKDPFLQSNKWSYNMYFTKIGNDYMRNDEIVKGFYLAHNADRIIIIGNEKIAREYKSYFLENGVTANIELHPIDMIDGSKQRVNVLFFSKKQFQNSFKGE